MIVWCARFSTLALAALVSGCGSIKEGNPLLLPLAIPVIVGAEAAMMLGNPNNGASRIEFLPPTWDPFVGDGAWTDSRGQRLIVGDGRVRAEFKKCILTARLAGARTATDRSGLQYPLEEVVLTSNDQDGCQNWPVPAKVDIEMWRTPGYQDEIQVSFSNLGLTMIYYPKGK
ncbi:MAG: hypothetical protein VX755_10170 [Pseudomonadota bacterium]|jgi:hypothetical protein|nr:hypothetical protein [Pseudomonadota bacterium]MED5537949.1 hypothetical protein [Pseudomonadota bacterium]